jgi:hypothetical protein
MPWTPDSALNALWAGLDTPKTNGEVRAYLKRHLMAAYAAGVREAADPNPEVARRMAEAADLWRAG